MDKQILIEEYRERNFRWTDKTLSQLSFYNNFILSLSIGFITLAYEMERIDNVTFSNNPDCSLTIYVISIVMITISIILGIIVCLKRLYDFRVTKQINQIRQRALEHSDKKLDEKTPDKYHWAKRKKMFLQIIFEKYPKITIENCKELKHANEEKKKQFDNDFRELRNISYNLGLETWNNTKWQTLYLIFAVISYVISYLI